MVVVVVGLAVGACLGALGGGGSILTVPALVYLLGESAHSATTVSLVVVGLSALAGTAVHARAGRVSFARGATFGALGAAGSVVGSRLSASVNQDVLLVSFACLMLLAAAGMTIRSRRVVGARAPVASDPVGTAAANSSVGTLPPLQTARRGGVALVSAATVVGLVTGFFGVGGGFLVLPALVIVLGFEMPVAVGTSLLVIAINSGVALLARLGTPIHLGWLLIVFTAAAMAGSIAGTRIAALVNPRRLAASFSLLLVGVALYTVARSVPHLG